MSDGKPYITQCDLCGFQSNFLGSKADCSACAFGKMGELNDATRLANQQTPSPLDPVRSRGVAVGAFAEIVAEIENMQKRFPPPSTLCDNPQYSPNHVLGIVKAVRQEAQVRRILDADPKAPRRSAQEAGVSDLDETRWAERLADAFELRQRSAEKCAESCGSRIERMDLKATPRATLERAAACFKSGDTDMAICLLRGHDMAGFDCLRCGMNFE